MILPEFDSFEAAYNAGTAQVVYTRLVADLDTPVSAMLKIAEDKPNSFLLESVEGGDSRNRYSIIGLKPDAIWRTTGDAAEINRKARFDDGAFVPCAGGALKSL
ncbi:MAG: anthranilate synthase component I, partial [Nitratireductor sp.]